MVKNSVVQEIPLDDAVCCHEGAEQMVTKKEVEFVITPDGNVEFTIKGAKGGQCLPIAEIFKVLGKTTSEQATAEFYEDDTPQDVVIHES